MHPCHDRRLHSEGPRPRAASDRKLPSSSTRSHRPKAPPRGVQGGSAPLQIARDPSINLAGSDATIDRSFFLRRSLRGSAHPTPPRGARPSGGRRRPPPRLGHRGPSSLTLAGAAGEMLPVFAQQAIAREWRRLRRRSLSRKPFVLFKTGQQRAPRWSPRSHIDEKESARPSYRANGPSVRPSRGNRLYPLFLGLRDVG